MTSRIVSLADAVTAALIEADEALLFSHRITPARNYADDAMKLSGSGGVRVDVTPMAYDEADLVARGSIGYIARLRIGVRHRLGVGNQAHVDSLIKLTEEIHEFLATKQFGGAYWIDGSIPFVIVHQHLRDWQQFTAVISERFRIEADLCGEAAT